MSTVMSTTTTGGNVDENDGSPDADGSADRQQDERRPEFSYFQEHTAPTRDSGGLEEVSNDPRRSIRTDSSHSWEEPHNSTNPALCVNAVSSSELRGVFEETSEHNVSNPDGEGQCGVASWSEKRSSECLGGNSSTCGVPCFGAGGRSYKGNTRNVTQPTSDSVTQPTSECNVAKTETDHFRESVHDEKAPDNVSDDWGFSDEEFGGFLVAHSDNPPEGAGTGHEGELPRHSAELTGDVAVEGCSNGWEQESPRLSAAALLNTVKNLQLNQLHRLEKLLLQGTAVSQQGLQDDINLISSAKQTPLSNEEASGSCFGGCGDGLCEEQQEDSGLFFDTLFQEELKYMVACQHSTGMPATMDEVSKRTGEATQRRQRVMGRVGAQASRLGETGRGSTAIFSRPPVLSAPTFATAVWSSRVGSSEDDMPSHDEFASLFFAEEHIVPRHGGFQHVHTRPYAHRLSTAKSEITNVVSGSDAEAGDSSHGHKKTRRRTPAPTSSASPETPSSQPAASLPKSFTGAEVTCPSDLSLYSPSPAIGSHSLSATSVVPAYPKPTRLKFQKWLQAFPDFSSLNLHSAPISTPQPSAADRRSEATPAPSGSDGPTASNPAVFAPPPVTASLGKTLFGLRSPRRKPTPTVEPQVTKGSVGSSSSLGDRNLL
eukprot:GHVQ01023636.1.p1 GENE.GHVQ01023636.1~~GHVQ01023636.1.p1  ORF type:complete len:657 (-),score=94.34 GHVQ01023636.1:167-2137(-)